MTIIPGAAEAKEKNPVSNVVILFPDDWAAYSPTLTRLTARLGEIFTVQVHVLDTGRMSTASLDPDVYRRVRLNPRLARLLRKTGMYRLVRTIALARSARADVAKAGIVIAVDADGASAARLLGKPFHLLSLEIGWHPILRHLVSRHALSLTTQSSERLEYQFEAGSIARLPVFIVQNAPAFDEQGSRLPVRCNIDPERPRFVYLGNILPIHGLFPMLDLVRTWPKATLTLQGMHSQHTLREIHRRYAALLDGGRLRIGSAYVPENELGRFLEDFDIGLCLYQLGWRLRHNFNYTSSPAGKMFNYFAAGLPVIASRQIGLNPVSVHGAGLQVEDNSVEALRAAARTILADHEKYRAACLRAADHYDFNRSANRFVDFVRSSIPTR
jgi:glycosyltransferase involved in cell wall biosynthesis